MLSEAPESGDTIRTTLRRQKLTVPHWRRPTTVLLHSCEDTVARGGWFTTVVPDAVTFSCNALQGAGFRVSRKLAVFIALSQTTQMLCR